MERLTAEVRGRVQGVGFRHYTRQTARRLGLTGSVRNEPDGSVSVVAEGERARLEQLLHALQTGPSHAVVEEVEASWGGVEGGCDGFEVIR
jgi:acylphosphatase